MASKTTFTPEEWKQVLEGVMLSGMAVTAAEPSGLFGVLKESMATGKALLAAKSDPASNELIKAVVAEYETGDGRKLASDQLKSRLKGNTSADIRNKSIAALRDLSTLLDTKAPSDAAAFKVWLTHIAEDAAEASKEGGFMGFGGTPVSEAEKATLSELSSALGMKA